MRIEVPHDIEQAELVQNIEGRACGGVRQRRRIPGVAEQLRQIIEGLVPIASAIAKVDLVHRVAMNDDHVSHWKWPRA